MHAVVLFGRHRVERNRSRRELIDHRERDLENVEQRDVAERDGHLPLLRRRAVLALIVHLRYEVVEDAQPDEAVRDCRLQKLARLLHDRADVRRRRGGAVGGRRALVEPGEFRNAAEEGDDLLDGESLELRTLVGQQCQQVIACRGREGERCEDGGFERANG